MDGESVRVFSDNGKLPNGIEHNQIYYVITTLSANKIKLAKSFNTAVASNPAPIIIHNILGGKLEVVSYVTDKLPGEPGHPIQYDDNTYDVTRIVDDVSSTTTEVGGWYILASSDATNTIFSEFNTGNNADEIDKNYSI